MRRYDEKWVDLRVPENYAVAIGKSILAIAQLQTHDPIVLQRNIGYPLRFLAALVNNLTRLESWWVCDEGYHALIQLVESDDGDELGSAVTSIEEQLTSQDSDGMIDLPEEWCKCTGVPPSAT